MKKTYKKPVQKIHRVMIGTIFADGGFSQTPAESDVKSRNNDFGDNAWEEY